MLNFAAGNPITGYNLTRSLRFRSSASAYLNRTPATSTNRKVWTYSAWIKRGVLGVRQTFFEGYASGAEFSFFEFTSGDNLRILNTITGSTQAEKITTQVFRDPSAWYHIVIASNSSTSLNLYVNGVQVTSFSTSTGPNATDWAFNQILPQVIGADRTSGSTANPFDGYHAELNWIDGQALTPSSFGSTNSVSGVWQPARYTGTYGTNGFYLPFTDNSALTTSSNVGLGKDFSGNGNYWTTNNISITSGVTYDSMTDVPTLTSATAANFGVVNPIGNGSGTISNGNLRAVTATTLPDVGNFAMQSGKWYWEVTLTTASNPRVGVYDAGSALPTAGGLGGTALGWCIINGPSRIFNNNVATAYGSFNGSSGDVVMLAYDANTGRIWYGANGTWFASGDPATNANPSQTGVTGKAIVAATASGSGSNTFDYNFGQRPFAFSPPTGYVALNAYNLPTSTIVKGNTVMDATLWTGTGTGSAISISNLNFKPDFVWGKNRQSAYNHQLYDAVRGTGKGLVSNTTDAEVTNNANGYLSAFNSNGFSTVAGSSDNGFWNTTSQPYVAWAWQAGQGTTSSNTSGTITSTVSVNASAGFSVVTYTGTGVAATVGHGLGVAPSLIIVKRRDSTANWNVYHSSVGATGVLLLNTTDSTTTTSVPWNNTAPTSSVFTVGTGNDVNASGGTFVAYCWAAISGFSAMGSYVGNASADGPFVFTGFRPKYVLIKRSTGATDLGNWILMDTARDSYNVANNQLFPNTSNAENGIGGSGDDIDILSNGFKVRGSGGWTNQSGSTMVYICYAENPFKNSLAR